MISSILLPVDKQESLEQRDSFGFVDYDEEEEEETTTIPIVESDSSSFEDVASSLQAHPEVLRSSIRHVDSLANFVKHCEYQHSHSLDTEKAENDVLPSTAEQETKHKVHFSSNDPVVHEIPPVEESEQKYIWLMPDDFERQEREIKMTCFRWENHLSGKIPFDTQENTIRGLEHLYREKKQQASTKRRHRQAVHAEVARQKEQHGTITDWEHLRDISMSISNEDLQKSISLAQADYQAFQEAWEPPKASQRVTAAAGVGTVSGARLGNKKDKREKKIGKGLLFWKKK